jgi:hypothetical protein
MRNFGKFNIGEEVEEGIFGDAWRKFAKTATAP